MPDEAHTLWVTTSDVRRPLFGATLAGRHAAAAEPSPRKELAWLYLGACAVFALAMSLSPGTAQPEPSTHPPELALSAAEALEILDQGLQAMGTRQTLASFGPFEIRASGTLDKAAEGQGLHPKRPSPGPYREWFAIDAGADRIAWEYREERYDGTSEAFREAYLGADERLYVVHDPPLSIPARSQRFAAERRRLTRRIPQLALTELREAAPHLRLGKAASPGVHRLVGALADGTLLTVDLDAEQGLLRRLAYVAHLAAKGDTEVVWWFDDYRPVDGVGLFPFRYGSKVAGRTYTELNVEAVERGRSERFAAPSGYRVIPERLLDDEGISAEPPPLQLEPVAPGIYRVPEVRSGFAPLVVAFEEFVVVVDAPASFPLLGKIPAEETDPAPSFSWHAERLVDAIVAAFPGRQLRYVVLTHAHEDHVGGIRAFVAAGSTVLAAPEVRRTVEQILELPGSRVRDRLAEHPAKLRFEAVTEPRLIGDGDHRLEILPIGPNPHAAGLLVAHLPAEKMLFVSDLVTPETLDVYPRAAHAALDHFFAEWLAATGLEVERVLAMHGGSEATAEHLEQARRAP